jgi:hypothetical protein
VYIWIKEAAMSRPILSILILVPLSMTACVPTTAVQAPLEPATQAGKAEAQASQVLPALLVNAANRGLLYPIDPASGQALPDFEPIPLGKAYNYAFSPGADRLAFVSEAGQLTLIDLATWEYETFNLPLPRPAYQVTYSPDGERLAVAGGNRTSSLALIDTSQGRLVAESSLDFLIYQMKFTGDGSGLMVYGSEIQKRFTVNEMSPDPPWVALLDGADLSTRWTQALPGVQHGIVPTDSAREAGELDPVEDLHHSGQAIYLLPGLAFAPHRDTLYVAHAGDDMLTVVDFSARQVGTLEIHDQMSWIERLLSVGAGRARAKVAAGTALSAAISPDGRSLYVVGQTSSTGEQTGDEIQIQHTALGLQIIDTADGSRRGWYESSATELSLSPDGASLYLRAWGEDLPWTEVFDIASGQVKSRLEGQYAAPVRGMDGRMLLASSQGLAGDNYRYVFTDPASLQVVGEWTSQGYLSWVSPP